MLRLGPIVLMTTNEFAAYRMVLSAAYHLHQIIWFHGENNEPFGFGVEEADAELSEAISEISPPP